MNKDLTLINHRQSSLSIVALAIISYAGQRAEKKHGAESAILL